MRHLYVNFVLVFVSYSLALVNPATAKPRTIDGFSITQTYVNSKGKKSFKEFLLKTGDQLPPSLYEDALKQVQGDLGKKWFQAAKIATNYTYFRYFNSKVFIRTVTEKGQTVFYANGMKIHENDFRNMNVVRNKLFIAFVKGLPAKKTSMFDVLDFSKAKAAGKGRPVSNEAAGSGTAEARSNASSTNDCNDITAKYVNACTTGDHITAQALAAGDEGRECNLGAIVAGNTSTAISHNQSATSTKTRTNTAVAIGVIVGLILLFLLMKNKKKNKKKAKKDNTPKPVAETPEDTNGKGRGEDRPRDGDDYGNGPVNCAPGQTNCGNGSNGSGWNGTITPTPGEPTSSPTSYDPNYTGEPVAPSSGSAGSVPEANIPAGRTGVDNPVFKAKRKR